MTVTTIDPRIAGAIRRRGLSIHHTCPTKGLIFDKLTDRNEGLLYDQMKRYSVRLILRDIIKHQDGFTIEDIGAFAGPDRLSGVIDILAEIGIIEQFRDGFRLVKRPVTSFGPTLEWFIASLMQREFACPALWGVTFTGTDSGGDFDVISYFEDMLIYIEVTSAPPKGIEVGQARTFLARVNTLLPRAAFFFVDTQLRMRDRVVLLFHQEFLERMKDPFPARPDLRNLTGEIFHIDHRIFILNAYRDVTKNFTVCLRDFLSRGLSVL